MIEWIATNTSWMYWTWQSGLAIGGLFFAIFLMGVWDARQPSVKVKGFLPIPFTRGERFFISVVLLIAVMLIWLALTDANPLWAVAIALVLDFVVARYG